MNDAKTNNSRSTTDVFNLLENSISSLSQFPHHHPLISEELNFNFEIRKITVQNYYIYYWINENKQEVHMISVLYA